MEMIENRKYMHQLITYEDQLGEINNARYLLPGKQSTIVELKKLYMQECFQIL